jgi:hypothetical protein
VTVVVIKEKPIFPYFLYKKVKGKAIPVRGREGP